MRLCGIALEPFCAPVANGSSASPTSVRWRCRTSSANASIDAPTAAHAYSSSACGVACEHLRGRHRSQTEPLADERLHLRVDVGVAPHRAGHLADGDGLSGSHQPHVVAAQLQRPERELAPERDGLGMDAVRATGHRRGAVLPGASGDRRLELVDRVDDEVAGPYQRDRHGGVDDVVRREPVVHPFGGRAPDVLLDDVDEGRGLVIGDRLAGTDLVEGEGGPLPDRDGILDRDDPQLGPGLAGEDLDFQPGGESRLVGEEPGDLRQGVALYQGSPSSCRTLYEPGMADTAHISR